MAERIVSPGVFTRESDLSFLPQSIGAIGAAIVGPTVKGPAFVPMKISSFQDFEAMFGGQDDRFYTPQTVEQYLKSAGVVTVVRVLGLGGYQADSVALQFSSSAATTTLAILAPSRGSSGTGDLSGTHVGGITLSASAGNITTLGNATVSASNNTWDSFCFSFTTYCIINANFWS